MNKSVIEKKVAEYFLNEFNVEFNDKNKDFNVFEIYKKLSSREVLYIVYLVLKDYGIELKKIPPYTNDVTFNNLVQYLVYCVEVKLKPQKFQ